MDALLLFILTSLALTGSPGPNTLSLAALSAAFGRRRVVPYMAGLNLGMVGVVALVGSGFWAVLLSWPGVAPVVTIAASLYLLYLAFRIATAPPLGARTTEAAAVPHWYAGAALSLSNPKAYVAVAAVFSRYSLVPGRAIVDQVAKGGLLLAIIVAVNILWLVAGSLLARTVRKPGIGRFVNIAFAALLVLSVVFASLV